MLFDRRKKKKKKDGDGLGHDARGGPRNILSTCLWWHASGFEQETEKGMFARSQFWGVISGESWSSSRHEQHYLINHLTWFIGSFFFIAIFDCRNIEDYWRCSTIPIVVTMIDWRTSNYPLPTLVIHNPI